MKFKKNNSIDFLKHVKIKEQKSSEIDMYNLSHEDLNKIVISMSMEVLELKEQAKINSDKYNKLVDQIDKITDVELISNPLFHEDTINKLLNKIASLENKVNELSKYSPKQVATNEMKSSLRDHLEEQNNKSPDFIKILIELKIRSLATSILFTKSNFECADKIGKNIAFSFNDPSYVEMANQKIDIIKESVKYVLGCDYNVIIYLKNPSKDHK